MIWLCRHPPPPPEFDLLEIVVWPKTMEFLEYAKKVGFGFAPLCKGLSLQKIFSITSLLILLELIEVFNTVNVFWQNSLKPVMSCRVWCEFLLIFSRSILFIYFSQEVNHERTLSFSNISRVWHQDGNIFVYFLSIKLSLKMPIFKNRLIR